MLKVQLSLIFNFLLFLAIQAQDLQFKRAFKNGELPQVPISLLQDSKGFLWIGTTDGLYRYDGRELLEFRHDPQDTLTLSNNYIRLLFEDKAGNLWVGTKDGLNFFDLKKERITRCFPRSEVPHNILSITEDHKNRIWFGTYKGLFQFDPKNRQLLHLTPEPEFENTLTHEYIWSVYEDDKNRMWVTTHGGITIFENDDQFNFQSYYGDENAENGLNEDRFFDVVQDSSGQIWISSYGLFKAIENEGGIRFISYKNQKGILNSLSNDLIQTIDVGPDNSLWLGTYRGGLNQVKRVGAKNEGLNFHHFKNNPDNENTLSNNQINAFEIDASGLIWVGTGSGLDKGSYLPDKFRVIKNQENDPHSLSNNTIKQIFVDSYGNLWIGTYKGLNFLSAEKFKQRNFEFERFFYDAKNPHSISNNNIFAIHEDSNNFLWINTYYGLNYIHIPTFLKNKKFSSFNEKHGIPHTFNYKTIEIKQGEYWVGTYGGLAKMFYNPKNPRSPVRFENYESNEEVVGALVNSVVYDFVEDQFGNYWVGTYDGISKIINNEGALFFENYKNDPLDASSLSNNSFRCFFKDSKQRLWIGTRCGLNLVYQKGPNQKASFKIFGLQDGLPNDVIHAIEEDDSGKLWLSTNKGLVVFDPENLSEPVVSTYTRSDGLSSSSFVFRSSYKDESGFMYFGTGAGLNIFKPDSLPKNQFVPPVVFTKLKVLNKLIVPQDSEKPILDVSIPYAKKITLKHWQNIIEIQFAALDFQKPENNLYQYKLSSLNEDWVDCKHDNKVTFTNLAPGNHILLVKGSNNDGIWNETPAVLEVIVLPPFWKTWWAYLLYAIFGILMIAGIVRLRVNKRLRLVDAQNRLEKARQEERAQLRKKNAADFHDELGHRLTKISLFLELAERESKPESGIKNYLQKIKQNAAGLSQGVRDLIWSLDPDKDSLYQTLLRLQEFGDQLYEYSHVAFKTQGIQPDLDQTILKPDVKKQILLIFKEAMNNSLKYAEATEAFLAFEIKEQHAQLTFKDNGKGFNPVMVEKGYGLKNMKERAAKINGSLIIDAEKSLGTEIVLNWQIPQMG